VGRRGEGRGAKEGSWGGKKEKEGGEGGEGGGHISEKGWR